MLYFSRIIVGLGSATTSKARAHVTTTIPNDKRTCHLPYLSGLQSIGFAVLPIAGGTMSKLPKYNIWEFQFNIFTYPAWFLVIANLFCVYLVIQFYESTPPSPRHSYVPSISTLNNNNSNHEAAMLLSSTSGTSYSATSTMIFTTTQFSISREPDYTAVFICLPIIIVFRGVLAQLETASIPFMTEQFHIASSTASVYMAMIEILGTSIYFCFEPLSIYYSDRSLVLFCLLFIAAGCLPLSLHPFIKQMPFYVYLYLCAFTRSIAYPVGQTAILA